MSLKQLMNTKIFENLNTHQPSLFDVEFVGRFCDYNNSGGTKYGKRNL